MAALGSTISAEDLALAGITGPLATALTGLTWSEAKAKLGAVVGLSAGNEALKRGAVVSYTLNGRSISSDLEQLNKAMAAISAGLRFATSTGGITSLPIEWGR